MKAQLIWGFAGLVAPFALLPLLGCAASPRPVARTVNDLGREACAIYFSKRQGISFEEAARTICTIRDIVDPFIGEQKAAMVAAGAQVERSGALQK